MGAGNLFRGQIIKGLIFIAAEVAYIGFMIDSGLGFIAGLRNLGTVQRGWYFDETLGIDVMRENGRQLNAYSPLRNICTVRNSGIHIHVGT